MKAKPGSKEFNALLINRLHYDLDLEGCETMTVDRVESVSRNTLILRISGGRHRLVGKVQLRKPVSTLAAEYKILCELEQRLCLDGVRSLSPIALYHSLGVLITREESGNSLRQFIDRGLNSHDGSKVRKRAESLIERAAYAMYAFHSAFGIQSDAEGTEIARQYLDFSPRNLLITGEELTNEIVLIDPPEFECNGAVHLDLGTLCFDLARASFMPNVYLIPSLAWLDRLKLQFLKSYFLYLGRPMSLLDLKGIRNGEELRSNRVLYWYSRFYRYKSWPKELARFLYFSPIVVWYKNIYLNRSYKWLSQQLAGL